MSQAADVVRRMYEARDAGDADGVLACLHADVLLDARPRMDTIVVRGRDEARRVIAEWTDAFDDWREDIHEIRDLGSQVFVAATQRGLARETGVEIEARYALLYRVEDDQITQITLFSTEDEALASASGRE
jgi:ketosteroid isomerase-like protein